MTQFTPIAAQRQLRPTSIKSSPPGCRWAALGLAETGRLVAPCRMAARQGAIQIVQRLQQDGFEAYWVGGCVRDRLLGLEPADYDIATSARPNDIERIFPHTQEVGRQFGVILVHLDRIQFQVATFRAEAPYLDGRHPSAVEFTSARNDAARRDFTVNGLFYDPIRDEIHDWVGGRDDLERKLIRTIGAPRERFAEDHLRILRAPRFAAQLGFELEPETSAAILEQGSLLRSVSAERIREELLRLLRPPHAARGLELLRATRLLEHLIPELVATIDCAQSPEWHPEGTVFQHIVRMLECLPSYSDPLLPWAVLFHDIAKPPTASTDPTTGEIRFYGHETVGAAIAAEILERLRFPRRAVETVATCVRYHMQFKDAPNMRKSTLKRMLARPTFPLELELHRLDCLGSHGRLDHHEFLVAEQSRTPPSVSSPPPLVTGHDLIALGFKPGPAMGALLRQIREQQLQEELATRDEAIEFARRRLSAPLDPS